MVKKLEELGVDPTMLVPADEEEVEMYRKRQRVALHISMIMFYQTISQLRMQLAGSWIVIGVLLLYIVRMHGGL